MIYRLQKPDKATVKQSMGNIIIKFLFDSYGFWFMNGPRDLTRNWAKFWIKSNVREGLYMDICGLSTQLKALLAWGSTRFNPLCLGPKLTRSNSSKFLLFSYTLASEPPLALVLGVVRIGVGSSALKFNLYNIVWLIIFFFDTICA